MLFLGPFRALFGTRVFWILWKKYESDRSFFIRPTPKFAFAFDFRVIIDLWHNTPCFLLSISLILTALLPFRVYIAGHCAKQRNIGQQTSKWMRNSTRWKLLLQFWRIFFPLSSLKRCWIRIFIIRIFKSNLGNHDKQKDCLLFIRKIGSVLKRCFINTITKWWKFWENQKFVNF